MDKQVLKADKRKITGRKVKTLRKEGILPANIYGKKIKSQAVSVKEADFEKAFASVGETGLLELSLDGQKRPVLVHNIQKDPVSDKLLHVDFLQVDLKEKVSAKVPVELSGESPAEKQGLGTVVQYLNEVEVEALPSDLPEKFVLSIQNLAEVDQAIKVSDLPIDRKKVEVKADAEQILVKVEPPQKVEEVAPPAEEVPAEGAEVAGGEIPAEGVPTEEGVKPQGEESSEGKPQA